MKIVIAPDSYKGSLTAVEVCACIEEAIIKISQQVTIVKLPVSDGGEGLVEVLLGSNPGRRIKKDVEDPLNRLVTAEYGILDNGVAVIEMAAASGLPRLQKSEYNPLKTSTFGTGELIRDAVLNYGCTDFILGIGGSATNDGGMGVGSALGLEFLDHDGNKLSPCGGNLQKVVQISTSNLIDGFEGLHFTIACDVDNPLCGKSGAAYVYGPQKGADEAMIKTLDQGLAHFGRLLEEMTGKELVNIPGIGAAGGMALPMVAFLAAGLNSGLDIVLDNLNFDSEIEEADLVITGEGKTDDQSAMGKVVGGIAGRCQKAGVPLIVISGALEEGYEKLLDQGVTACFATYENGRELSWHLEHAKELLRRTAINIFKVYLLNNKK